MSNCYENLSPGKKKVFMTFALLFGVVWILMIVQTAEEGHQAGKKAEAMRRQQQARVETQQAIDRALEQSRQDVSRSLGY